MKKILGIMCIVLITQSMAIPKNFKEKSSEGGITIYESTDKLHLHYVQKIDLSKGATLKNLFKETGKTEVNVGDNKGTKYWFYKQSIKSMWTSAIKEDSKIECISNGQYFALKANPTTISYPVKEKNKLYDGSSSPYLKEYQKVLDISDSNKVTMKKFNLSQSKNDNVLYTNMIEQTEGKYSIIGIDTSYCYGCTTAKGRTLIGIIDEDTILIFTSQEATQSFAKDTLINGFNARDVMMLDGSGSAQLKCGNEDKDTLVIGDRRYLAHGIATVKGEVEIVPTIKEEVKILTYTDKVNFIFDKMEEKYSSYFPKGAKTRKSKKYLYRIYNKKYALIAYNNNIHIAIIGSRSILWGSVDKLYNKYL